MADTFNAHLEALRTAIELLKEQRDNETALRRNAERENTQLRIDLERQRKINLQIVDSNMHLRKRIAQLEADDPLSDTRIDAVENDFAMWGA